MACGIAAQLTATSGPLVRPLALMERARHALLAGAALAAHVQGSRRRAPRARPRRGAPASPVRARSRRRCARPSARTGGCRCTARAASRPRAAPARTASRQCAGTGWPSAKVPFWLPRSVTTKRPPSQATSGVAARDAPVVDLALALDVAAELEPCRRRATAAARPPWRRRRRGRARGYAQRRRRCARHWCSVGASGPRWRGRLYMPRANSSARPGSGPARPNTGKAPQDPPCCGSYSFSFSSCRGHKCRHRAGTVPPVCAAKLANSR